MTKAIIFISYCSSFYIPVSLFCKKTCQIIYGESQELKGNWPHAHSSHCCEKTQADWFGQILGNVSPCPSEHLENSRKRPCFQEGWRGRGGQGSGAKESPVTQITTMFPHGRALPPLRGKHMPGQEARDPGWLESCKLSDLQRRPGPFRFSVPSSVRRRRGGGGSTHPPSSCEREGNVT